MRGWVPGACPRGSGSRGPWDSMGSVRAPSASGSKRIGRSSPGHGIRADLISVFAGPSAKTSAAGRAEANGRCRGALVAPPVFSQPPLPPFPPPPLSPPPPSSPSTIRATMPPVPVTTQFPRLPRFRGPRRAPTPLWVPGLGRLPSRRPLPPRSVRTHFGPVPSPEPTEPVRGSPVIGNTRPAKPARSGLCGLRDPDLSTSLPCPRLPPPTAAPTTPDTTSVGPGTRPVP